MKIKPEDILRAEFGSLYRLAKTLGLQPNAVYQWQNRGRVPFKHIREIEVLSEGRVTRKELRPDIFGEQ